MHPIRSSVAVLATLALALVAISPVVVAQDDAAEHPIVGAWMVDPTPEDPSDPLELLTVAPGGVAIPSGTEGPAAGAWESTGERSADVTFVAPSVDPQAGFLGFITGRVSIEVSEDGQSFLGTYTIEFPAAMSEAFGMPAGQLGPGEVTGQRVGVEPMGEPVGPLPDFSELFPPPGDGPPGPEESPAG